MKNLSHIQKNISPIDIQHIKVCGKHKLSHSLSELCQQKNIDITFEQSASACFIVNDIHIAITDGRMATERSAIEGINNLILFDLALDYVSAGRIAISAAEQASDIAIETAAAFFQLLGKTVSPIDDIPGMIVMRTVCMLVNEGADTVNQQICTAQAIDTAMQSGVNYPLGPLAWADHIGLEHVIDVLTNLARTYGKDRYRISPLLQKKSFANQLFHD